MPIDLVIDERDTTPTTSTPPKQEPNLSSLEKAEMTAQGLTTPPEMSLHVSVC